MEMLKQRWEFAKKDVRRLVDRLEDGFWLILIMVFLLALVIPHALYRELAPGPQESDLREEQRTNIRFATSSQPYRLEPLAENLVRACPEGASSAACITAPLAFVRWPVNDPWRERAVALQREMIAKLAPTLVECSWLEVATAAGVPVSLHCALGDGDPRRALAAAGLAMRDDALCGRAEEATEICNALTALEDEARLARRGIWWDLPAETASSADPLVLRARRDADASGRGEAGAIEQQTIAILIVGSFTLVIAGVGATWLIWRDTPEKWHERTRRIESDKSILEGLLTELEAEGNPKNSDFDPENINFDKILRDINRLSDAKIERNLEARATAAKDKTDRELKIADFCELKDEVGKLMKGVS